MSHWLYKDEQVNEMPPGKQGFVYLITNLLTDKKYIGRKYATTTRRKPLTKKQRAAGRVRKDVIKKDSNWANYTGSNIPLNKDIEEFGKENFKFEILYFGSTKGIINYIEENLHMKHDVILREDYYNDCVGPRGFMALRQNKELKEILL